MSITTEFQKFFTSGMVGMVEIAFHRTDLQLAYSMPGEEPCFEGLVGFRIVTEAGMRQHCGYVEECW